MEIKIKSTTNNTANLEAILSPNEVAIEKEHAVDHLIDTVTVKGFRQGKAPRAIAAEQIDPDKLSNHILNHVLNNIIDQALRENKLRLLGRPVLENIDAKDKEGWLIKISLPLYPEIDLKNYQKLLPKPGKSKSAAKETEEQKIDRIYQVLLDKVKIDVPQSVIEEEVNYSLERLTSQAKTLNLTLENYLKAVNKNLDQVKLEYAKKAEESIKLDLILLEIAKVAKIDTDSEEIKKIAASGGVADTQLSQLKTIIDRRKTVELLLKLC